MEAVSGSGGGDGGGGDAAGPSADAGSAGRRGGTCLLLRLPSALLHRCLTVEKQDLSALRLCCRSMRTVADSMGGGCLKARHICAAGSAARSSYLPPSRSLSLFFSPFPQCYCRHPCSVRALCDPSRGLAARFPTLPRVELAVVALDLLGDEQFQRLAAGLAALGSLTALRCTPTDRSVYLKYGPTAWPRLARLLTGLRQLRSVDLTGLVDMCADRLQVRYGAVGVRSL